jgi:hypothetical protein
MRLTQFSNRERNGRLRTEVSNEARLYGALKALFDLLENYGPVWYTLEYHDQAKTALVMHGHSLKEGPRSFRKAA